MGESESLWWDTRDERAEVIYDKEVGDSLDGWMDEYEMMVNLSEVLDFSSITLIGSDE